MVGIVIVTHGNLAEELVNAAEMIVGRMKAMTTVSIGPSEQADRIRERIDAAIQKVDEGEGVIILTDMFGGTPSNVSLSFLEEKRIEVLSGLNLPMLLKLSTCRQEDMGLAEMAEMLMNYGRKNISLASVLLREKRK